MKLSPCIGLRDLATSQSERFAFHQLDAVMGIHGQRSPSGLIDVNSGMLTVSSDGKADWPRTLRLAKSAIQDGVQRAIVTAPFDCLSVARRRMPQFMGLLAQHGIGLQVTLAVEMQLASDLFQQAATVAASLDDSMQRYVFLRIPEACALPIVPVIDRLANMNLTPVLLAPERCGRFRESLAELHQMVQRGVLVQIAAASLTDQTDRAGQRLCKKMIRQGLCHFIASESGRHHDLPVLLSEAYQIAVRWSGAEVCDALFRRNAEDLLTGDSVRSVSKHRTVFGLFGRAA